MPHALKHIDTERPTGQFGRWYAAIAATRPARFVSRHLNWKLDPWLLRLSRGRVSTTLVFPTDVLETTGARSGERRRNAVIYFHDGDRVIIVASNAGAARHPSWYHNLRAHPDVTFAGIPMHASEIRDPRPGRPRTAAGPCRSRVSRIHDLPTRRRSIPPPDPHHRTTTQSKRQPTLTNRGTRPAIAARHGLGPIRLERAQSASGPVLDCDQSRGSGPAGGQRNDANFEPLTRRWSLGNVPQQLRT